MSYDYKKWIPKFSLRNFTLSSLTAEASIDIENYIYCRNQETESVKYLSKLLDEITQGEKPLVMLPDNCVVLSYAISGREKFKKYWEGKCVDEVLLQTNLISKDLRDFENLPKPKQEELSDFCVRLSKEISYYQSEYFPRYSKLTA